jgi:hypothetical protein
MVFVDFYSSPAFRITHRLREGCRVDVKAIALVMGAICLRVVGAKFKDARCDRAKGLVGVSRHDGRALSFAEACTSEGRDSSIGVAVFTRLGSGGGEGGDL